MEVFLLREGELVNPHGAYREAPKEPGKPKTIAELLAEEAENKRAELLEFYKVSCIDELRQAAVEGYKFKKLIVSEHITDKVRDYLKGEGFTAHNWASSIKERPGGNHPNSMEVWVWW